MSLSRRSFLSGLTSIAALFGIRFRPDVPEHVYHWNTTRPWTSNPDHMPLRHGASAPLVYLDGQLMNDSGLRIGSVYTGRNGYLVVIDENPDGSIKTSRLANGEHIICWKRIDGIVDVKPRKESHVS